MIHITFELRTFFYCQTGQTPIMLAEEDDEMVSFLRNHLMDVQNTGPNKMPWKLTGAWKQKGRNPIKILYYVERK